MKDCVVRVATKNNFNYTMDEIQALYRLKDKGYSRIFVNSNSFVKITSEFPSIITVNPYLTEFVEPKGDLSNVKAVRVKYVSGAKPEVERAFENAMYWARTNDIPILITYMRFKKKDTMNEYVDDTSNYEWKGSYYRQKVHREFDDVYYCDFDKKGCPDCRNCAKLTFDADTDDIREINLSESGICEFHCPDCFARYDRIRCKGKIAFDKVKANWKQKGKK